jgi:Uma2 family endonuclease
LARFLQHGHSRQPVESGSTWVTGERQAPQSDITLRVLPEYGGQSGIAGEYHSGAPELIVEVAVSSHSRDFGAKKRLYERMGVREYRIVTPRCSDKGVEELGCFSGTPQGFQPIVTGADGIFRSQCFPGLWLDMKALWDLDLARMNAVLQQGLATPEHADFAAQLAKHKPPSQS